MFSFLDPKVWAAVALATLLSFSGGYLYGDHKRGHLDDLEKTAEIAKANEDARTKERQLQDFANLARKFAAIRENKLLADAALARRESSGLRNDTDALKLASEKSLSAALASLGLTSDLLNRCTERYTSVAEAAQRTDSEARELREAWPQ